MVQITGRLRTPRLSGAPANPMPGEVFFHTTKDVLCVYRSVAGWSDIPLLTAAPPGPKGEPGPQGPPGIGLPSGGLAGQILVKLSDDDYDFAWVDPVNPGVPGPRGGQTWAAPGPPPDEIPGAQPGDNYVDTDTGDAYHLID